MWRQENVFGVSFVVRGGFFIFAHSNYEGATVVFPTPLEVTESDTIELASAPTVMVVGLFSVTAVADVTRSGVLSGGHRRRDAWLPTPEKAQGTFLSDDVVSNRTEAVSR